VARPVAGSSATEGGAAGGGSTAPAKKARGDKGDREASSRWQSASAVSQAASTARRTAEAEGVGGGVAGSQEEVEVEVEVDETASAVAIAAATAANRASELVAAGTSGDAFAATTRVHDASAGAEVAAERAWTARWRRRMVKR